MDLSLRFDALCQHSLRWEKSRAMVRSVDGSLGIVTLRPASWLRHEAERDGQRFELWAARSLSSNARFSATPGRFGLACLARR